VTWLVPSQCPTIQAGIDSAAYGDTVLVAPGTYYEHDVIMKDGVTLRSESGPEATVVDAQDLGRVFFCDGGDEATRIDGFTITGGHAWDELGGGGIYCGGGSPVVRNSVMTGNHAAHNGGFSGCGGGLMCGENSAALIEGNTIFANRSDWDGGGVCAWTQSSPAIMHNFIYENDAGCGAGIACEGGTTLCRIEGNTIHGNRAQWDGGGILTYETSPLIVGNDIKFNWAGQGGGIAACDGAHIEGNMIVSNVALIPIDTGYGGGVWVGNTISHNGMGGVHLYDPSTVIEHNIISFNDPWGVRCEAASFYCCNFYNTTNFQGNCGNPIGTNGNFSENPLFCSPWDDDFRLDCNSPCVHGYGCVEPTTWGAIKAMYR
jgi:nitrous oxidase accessory protein NosD